MVCSTLALLWMSTCGNPIHLPEDRNEVIYKCSKIRPRDTNRRMGFFFLSPSPSCDCRFAAPPILRAWEDEEGWAVGGATGGEVADDRGGGGGGGI
jgi:hypothetical protein